MEAFVSARLIMASAAVSIKHMIDWKRTLAVIAQVVGAISLLVIACKMSTSATAYGISDGKPAVDYVNFVVILLTVVTVIFTVGALILAIFGVFGFENLKKEAANFASESAMTHINSSFKDGGAAYSKIQQEVENEDGHLKRWMKDHINQEVVRAVLEARSLRQIDGEVGFDLNEPTDQGDVD
jgi:hypothetical protein